MSLVKILGEFTAEQLFAWRAGFNDARSVYAERLGELEARLGRADQIRDAASCLVWKTVDGVPILADWKENAVPAARLYALLQADFDARRAVLVEQEKQQP